MNQGNIIPAEHAACLQPAMDVVRSLRTAGHEAFFAGGVVRDLLLHRQPKDVDIATAATPDQILEVFGGRCREVGKAFGVVLVPAGDDHIEVATFRRDMGYTDGRRPDSVVFAGPEEDAHRRDFTINGLFYDPIERRVIDFVGGLEDLQRKVVRAIGKPAERFGEDYLRMVRAIRFAACLDFTLDEATEQAIREAAPLILRISAERIYTELTCLLTEAPRSGEGLRLLRSSGLLHRILPEIEAMSGVEQPPQFHPEGDVFTHTAMMLDAMERPTPTLAYAVLLHDVGKPPTAELTRESDGTLRMRFNQHAVVGADLAEGILTRLKMPTRHKEAVVYCVRNHMRFMDVRKMKRSTLRRLMGARTFPVELELHRLDCLCSHGDLSNYEFLVEQFEALRDEPVLPTPWIDGHDLLALGVEEGPDVGRWHRTAYEAQLEDRFSDRSELLTWLSREIVHSLEP